MRKILTTLSAVAVTAALALSAGVAPANATAPANAVPTASPSSSAALGAHVSRAAQLPANLPASLLAAAPASGTQCQTTLTAAEKASLIKASDTSTLTEIPDALKRLKTINGILAVRGDYRGTFPVFYEVILTRTQHVMATEKFNDPVWSKKIAIEFVSEYFRNLHGHLSGGAVTTYWKEFYKLAADCKRSAGRVAAQALVTHMIDDFPRALIAVKTTSKNREDFLHYGDALIEATPQIIANVKKYYGVDLKPLFQLYLVGDVFGSSTVTTAFFSSVRSLAWSNYQWLSISKLIGRSKIAFYWSAASTLMASFELKGKL